MAGIKNLVNMRQSGIFVALVAIVLLFQIWTNGTLLSPPNVSNLVLQYSYILILAIGMLFVIVVGHIDLSVGSIVGLVGAVAATLLIKMDMPWWIAALAGILVGVLIGAWHGFWVAYVGIPAFIVTLAGMLIFRGLAIVLVGVTVAGFPQQFVDISNGSLPNVLGYVANRDLVTLLIGVLTIAVLVIGQVQARRRLIKHELHTEPLGMMIGRLVLISLLIGGLVWVLAGSRGGSPTVLLIVGALIIAYSFVMGRTVFGRHVYAIGGNLHAAILSGVDTRRVNFWIFVNMGVLAGIAAIVTTSRAGAANAAAGQNFELDAIAACFIGGTAVTGGIGRVSGAIVGALIMGVLNMGLSIMSVDPSWQQAIKGLVLLLAVAFDLLNKRRGSR